MIENRSIFLFIGTKSRSKKCVNTQKDVRKSVEKCKKTFKKVYLCIEEVTNKLLWKGQQ